MWLASFIWWLVSWILLSLIWKFLVPYFNWRNSKLRFDQKYSDSEYEEILKSEFSKGEKFLFTWIIISSIMFCLVGSIFWGLSLFYYVQENYYIDSSSILYNVPEFNMAIICFIGLFAWWMLNNIFLNFVGYKSVRFNIFVTKNRAIKTGIREIEDKEKKAKDMVLSFRILIVFLLVVYPLVVLSLGNYYYIDSEGLNVNSYTSSDVKKYNWEDIEKAIVGARAYKDDGRLKFDFSYNLILKDGNSFDIRWDIKNLEKVDSLISSKGIEIERNWDDLRINDYVNGNYSEEKAKIILKLIKD